MKRTGLLALAALALGAQEKTPDYQVNPNRPSFANPATTTAPGWAELEWGPQRTLFPDGSRSDFQATLLKLGITDNFEIRLGWNGIQRNEDPSGQAQSGPADPQIGFTWHFAQQDRVGADLGLSYNHKIPRASVEKGIGSGEPDDTLVLLVSKDALGFHGDLNLLETWVGQPGGGRVRQPAAALALTHPIAGAWSYGAEVYAIGGGAAGPRDVATLWNLAYQVSPRLVLDAGFDHGLNPEAPRWNYFVGLTWGVGRFLRKP